MPHFARLRDQGGLARLATTSPAQTPVAWSTFATSLNPGGHRIFDFLRRNPQTYLPDLALNEYEQKNAFTPPKAVNLRRGTPVWDVLHQAGVPSTILRCPCTYPPDTAPRRILAGMGVPDLRGGLGSPTFFTTDPNDRPRESEQLALLHPQPDGSYLTHLPGPRNPKDRSDLAIPLQVRPDPANRHLIVESPGQPSRLVVPVGSWSPWVRVKFKAGLLLTVRGIVRFHALAADPQPRLYASPVNFDPAAPLFPISHPFDYARELADSIGLYHTTGMVEDHTGLNNERLSEDAFLAHCDDIWRERNAMTQAELARHADGLFYVLHDTTDRVQHLFWRFREPDHPANRGRPARPDLAAAIEDQYRRADAALALALDHADDQTLLVALSDHGFNSFRRGVELNAWLRDHGLLQLKPDVEPASPDDHFLQAIDWSQTKAYALGLTGLYLNLAGREGHGIVPPDEAERLKADLAAALTGLTDPATGQVAINAALPRESVYHGPFLADAPDLVLHYNAGYRAGWAASMGGIGRALFEDNTKPWAGDHIIDPALVPGVLLMNRPFRHDGARLIDLAPTILDALGVPKLPAMEGSSLLS
ncbi:MAG: hypothetical protein KatS3mg108_2530 [Isosphaeraceae bacterium]|nr:MAG: hypothetical protein KatS3mg108_2530 [Isosphaeraceae bacterium]